MKPSVQDIRLGAIFRFGARHNFGRSQIAALITKRLGWPSVKADQLAAHWMTTEPYRVKR